ncbi:hypothetical protein [Janthinobacterium psychrotolerans]|uniref:Uncharacterized protein n=1 Tax=Janthinobacterium psychrotolerans TaxID=1747903 RepID=A0A1A7BZM3_9BURK|nr:hypothetical protein [Janthinobacterium psychrotolerans]OBV38209.1 hypothetical protein ASR47_1005163 [Janthinobacterium psychrotolerans]
MMDLYRKFIDTALVKPFTGNPALAFLVLGTLLFFAGTRERIIFCVDIAPYLTDLGRTIVLTGVFSVIFKYICFINDSIEMANDDPVVDTDGYLRWVLAVPGKLLLPGQGYALVIIKE